MLTSASSEFLALCRSQVSLLTQGLGAALSIVYLTEELVEEGTAQAGLVPVVAYPESAVAQAGANALSFLPESSGTPLRLHAVAPTSMTVFAQSPDEATNLRTDKYQPHELDRQLLPNRQIVLPLMHEGVVMGLLVTGREDRAWNQQELLEIERIAQTLALASVLDQRREWFEQQLRQQQRLSAKQRDLLDNLLHQFRNPLTALRTFGRLLLKRLLPGDANREVAANIVRESDRLTELLQQFDRVIDLTTEEIQPRSLPSNSLFIEPSPAASIMPLLPGAETIASCCQVADVLEPLLASALALAPERNLELHSEISPNLPAVQVNAKVLREVLSNLIDNALKYTPAGGQIYIQVGLKQGSLQGIAISNTGPGIPSGDLEHIFERHYRGIQLSSGIAGTGLGLAIAKELIEQMHGEIQAFSPATHLPSSVFSGAGVTFIVWLPILGDC